MSTKRHYSAKILERMPNLRLLEIIGTHDIDGNFKKSFQELRCFRWRRCPWTRFPSSFRPLKLVSLHMPHSELEALWKGAMASVNLRIINLSYSRNLKSISDLSHLSLVDKLLLPGCRSLRKVHPSIGQLTNMSHLDLVDCGHLKELPESIGHLTNLGHLDLVGCVKLKRLPETIKLLTTLVSLNLVKCCNLTRLPEQLGEMKCLKMLDASYTSIEQLPDSTAQLKKLVKLNLYSCKKLRKLPEQIGNFESLKWFDASLTSIEQLPDSTAQLKKLVELKLTGCAKLRTLPHQIGNLESLKYFDAGYSAIEHLPDTFSGLVSLEKLHLLWCSKLKQLPDQLRKMQCLEVLYATRTASIELPDSIGLLSSLQRLSLGLVRNLPSSIWGLTSLAELSVVHEGMDGINLPDSVNDMKLKSLDLECKGSICLWLPTILSFSSLEWLSLSFGKQSFSPDEPYSLSTLSNLQHLTLRNWTRSECSFPELPLNLSCLTIEGYATLQMLPDLSSLKQLQTLHIWDALSLQSLPQFPPHLTELDVARCTSLQDLPDMSKMINLRYLSIRRCSNLKSISLKQSLVLAAQQELYNFEVDLPDREVAEWFSYKSSGSTLSFTIPPNSGDNEIGVWLWIVYKIKSSYWHGSSGKAVIPHCQIVDTNNLPITV